MLALLMIEDMMRSKIKENGKKEDKMTVAMAIEVLEKEIPMDRVKLIKKEGALEILKQID